MLLKSSFYGIHINSQDFSCLLENRPFLPKTLVVFWKIGLFYQRRLVSFGKSALFTKDERDMPKRQINFITAWTEIHKDELIANWELAINEEPLYKIEPLR